MERGQFTFYRSFWEAARSMPKKDRLAILEAIIRYGLDGDELPELTDRQKGFFVLIRPVLDTGRRKASGGKHERKTSQGQAKDKPKDIELDKELKIDIDIQTDNDKGKAGVCVYKDSFFDDFWQAYPWKMGRQEALEAWKTLDPDEKTCQAILASVDAWKTTPRWQNEGGRYIPAAEKFLLRGYWKSIPQTSPAKQDIPKGCTGLGKAELENIQRLLREG